MYNTIRQHFPILKKQINNNPLVYLDNAATTQKPQIMIDVLSNYYSNINANVHRGIHSLSEKATQQYEDTRNKVQQFINARSSKECIFTQGTTAAINLVASSFGEQYLNPGDEIIISEMEHHSNIVPWQRLCEKKQTVLKIIPLLPTGELDISKLDSLITDKTKFISIVHVSNALGTINPIKEIIAKAHKNDIPVLVDGAQAVSHLKVDVQDLDCDFYVFSSHKMYGPMGVGVLYGKEKWLDKMPPYQTGGDMILQVTFEKTIYNELPYKFEAGTMPIADIIALGATLDFLNSLNLPSIWQYEKELLQYATEKSKEIPELKIIGQAKNKISMLSFTMDNIHPHDIGTLLDQQGIAIRAGHHCAMPVMNYFQIPATARTSFAMYNTLQEIDKLFNALCKIKRLFYKVHTV